MFERQYRRRLDVDLARWQADGTITAATGAAIRGALGPPSAGIGIAAVVGIVGGLLIAAAFLAFVAANWSAIPRVARLAMLLVGIAGAHGLGALFARQARPYLADAAVAVGAIVFGASIALVGQMYHLAGDFAGALLLCAIGALAAAVLTASRGALAVALIAALMWSWARTFDFNDTPHLPFIAFWLIAVGLTIAWHSAPARHLVSIAALAWWIETGIGVSEQHLENPLAVLAAGTALMLGGALMMQIRGPDSVRALGATGGDYAAFALAIVLALAVGDLFSRHAPDIPLWIVGCGLLGFVLAIAASLFARRAGFAHASAAIAFGLIAAGVRGHDFPGAEWSTYAMAIAAALALIVSGMLDDVRPRVVAGWIGFAAVIAAITWAVQATLLTRSLFLAIAGGVAIVLALGLGRLLPKEAPQ
jgi:uncharacterized membrane protein